MNELALFAGAGGGLLGSVLAGWRTVCAVELDEFCREVLLRRQDDGSLPPFPIWDDDRTFDGRPWRGSVDIVSAGFPCQPFSTASRGRRVAADLFGEVERIVGEVRPRLLFLENVLANAFPEGARAALRRGCPADLGAPHHRERYWLAAYADDEEQPAVALDAQVARLPPPRDPGRWKSPPDRVLGMDDGLAPRLDQLRALGNGQVPCVANRVWRTVIRETYNRKENDHAEVEEDRTAAPG